MEESLDLNESAGACQQSACKLCLTSTGQKESMAEWDMPIR